ncbi:hypothetical protein BDB00DRAFT_939984 [Zychaea mexicana]|uniref:uncharacterized protein n=1 Tax=Zychaea mexicana TaxID=64656 RepID=UPI0022FDF064|nr:uncharacterized protein BDB00DRAFT_939984 [Zychaea mexicana]KAI9491833.1 hypothetical protein BDB00DRAFT_939984 [Zychaea mexicana]
MPALPTPAGTLSKLPIEITDYVLQLLEDNDLVRVGRVNSWYRNMVAPILTERITHQVEHDGWRIYVNAVSQLVVPEEEEEEEEDQVQEEQTTASDKSSSSASISAATTDTLEPLSEVWLDQEAKLLGELRSINSETLTLDFDAMPLDEEHGFRSLMTSNNDDDTVTSNSNNNRDNDDLISIASQLPFEKYAGFCSSCWF